MFGELILEAFFLYGDVNKGGGVLAWWGQGKATLILSTSSLMTDWRASKQEPGAGREAQLEGVVENERERERENGETVMEEEDLRSEGSRNEKERVQAAKTTGDP